MSALSVQPTFPIFTDVDGQPLEDGYIWIGTVNLPAQTNPISVYWDAGLTIPAAQPIRTLGGYPANNGTPARLYVNSDYSILVQNKLGSMVYSAPAATERLSDVVLTGLNAADVQYDPAGTGAVATTVQAKLRESVSVKDFGAVGDGVADDTTAIQAAIDYAESIIQRYVFSFQTITIHIPGGTYRTTDEIVTNFPLEIVGDGFSASIVKLDAGVLKPVFRVKGYAYDPATQIVNVASRFSDLGIRGSGWNSSVSGFTTANHGIHVEGGVGLWDPFLEVYNCNIRECSGAGIYVKTSQSLRVVSSVVHYNCVGIVLVGAYNTDFIIDKNIIRANGRGVVVAPDSGVTFASGQIKNNLIESNLYGVGLQFGASERQAVGVWLTRCQQIIIENNYFEGHLNDIYLDTVSQSLFLNNNHQVNSLNQLYNWLRTNPGLLMARQIAAYYVVGVCVGNIIERNFVYKPVKPANITDTQWGTAIWGSEYEHFPALAGFNSLINNIWIGPSGGVEDVTFNPVSGAGITNYESISNIQYGGSSANGRLNRNQQVYTGAYRHALEASHITQLFKIARPEDFSPGRVRLMSNRTQTTKFDVEYAKCDANGVQDPAYTATQIARVAEYESVVGWTFPKASGFYMEDQSNRFVAVRMGTAAPSTGTWKVGDQVWNQAPAAGGNIGWVCTTAGTPGTWKTFGTIAP